MAPMENGSIKPKGLFHIYLGVFPRHVCTHIRGTVVGSAQLKIVKLINRSESVASPPVSVAT